MGMEYELRFLLEIVVPFTVKDMSRRDEIKLHRCVSAFNAIPSRRSLLPLLLIPLLLLRGSCTRFVDSEKHIVVRRTRIMLSYYILFGTSKLPGNLYRGVDIPGVAI